MSKLKSFFSIAIRRVLLVVFIFLLLVPKNWPGAAQRFIVWSAGLTAGVKITHLDLFLTHIQHESTFRQFEEDFHLWKFSFGKPLVGISGDIGIGQISPIYHEINFFTRWSTFLNARQAAKYFAEGCSKGESCTYAQMITHYTGKSVTDPRVTNTLIALEQNPHHSTFRYIGLMFLSTVMMMVLLRKQKIRKPVFQFVKSLR